MAGGYGMARLPGNVAAAQGFVGLFMGFVVMVSLAHWTRWLYYRQGRAGASSNNTPTWAKPMTVLSRQTRRVLVRKVPFFTSGGHALVVILYLALNMVLTFTKVFSYAMPSSYASRFGWMIALNVCATVFLALKNTPLAILTPYSYERLNPLHQVSGYLTILYTFAHAFTWLGYFASSGNLHVFSEESVIVGAVSGLAMFLMGLGFVVLRHFSYETFYIVHVSLFMLAIITMALHQPAFASRVIIIIMVAGSLWATDKLIRAVRFLVYSINNTATLNPLPNGGTRVTLSKTPVGAAPGKHLFLWIPGVKALQMHPFSIVSTNPTELVINSCDGFTKHLHDKAVKQPGVSLKASMEGPYGTFPDPLQYDKIVLISGGSGGSFTFGLAVNALERMTANATQEIVFVWAVREHEHLSWYTNHLNTILTHEHAPRVNIAIHVTKGSPEKGFDWIAMNSSGATTIASGNASSDESATYETGKANKDIEVQEKNKLSRSNSSTQSTFLRHGRPDVAAEVREAIRSTSKHQRVLVAACGPAALMNTVRNTTAECISVDGPSVELHLEQFGW